MSLTYQHLQTVLRRHASFLRQLEALYAQMDALYTAAAGAYGFECRGCDENCCLTRFHHHTLLEAAGLFAGYRSLPEDRKRSVAQRARDYVHALQNGAPCGPPLRHLCPLNLDTRCLLYPMRPMICRLHGIPHILRHPAKGAIAGPGCHIFEAQCRSVGGRPLERTSIYTAMAGLEGGLRRASGLAPAVRLTVAEMVICFDEAYT